MEIINLQDKFARFQEQWSPKLVAELNGQAVKLVKVQGEFVWHHHEAEDELFFVVQGKLNIEFRDKTVELQAGEMIVVPRGVEHRPYAEQEAWLMLFEPMATLNTGNVTNERTVEDVKRV